jgi:class 3 adenylate cyclase/predicted ATPase
MTDTRQWLEELGLGQYADTFDENALEWELLPDLTDELLEKLGVSAVGHRMKMLKAAAALAAAPAPLASPAPTLSPEAERRQLTVMFCDLVGSTALSERLDPEDLRALMTAYRDTAGAVVARYDGTVAQYLGDGLMIYFGWPNAHEDDAIRAVRAGLDILAAVKGLAAPEPLAVRIGIATGPVVVGHSANEQSDARLAVGETPNIAARLQSLAEPDSVILADSTRRLIAGTFDLDDLGSHDVKGISAPVSVYRVVGESTLESRFEAAQLIGLTPLVGRDEEIGLLLKRWEQACDGDGQIVVVTGEPGIGKSRITQALRERIGGEAHVRLRYQCSPYHINSAFHPIIDQLARAARFEREDGAEARLDKLEALLQQTPGDAPAPLAPFATMLSLPAERYPPLPPNPQQQKQDFIAALADQTVALSTSGPVLMIFEDAHWVDPSTLEALDRVIDSIQGASVLLVITCRPEFAVPWTARGHVTLHSLNRLGRRQGADMVTRVTGGKAMPDEVLDQIIAKTDGVPLFVEELTKTVLESGFLRAEEDRYVLDDPLPPLAVPATLQDSLMARLDRLGAVKEIAQIGACIGRDFEYDLLSEISPRNDLDTALDELLASELIFRHGSGKEAIFSFKHALVQDAAYESLLKSRRQEIHANLASILRSREASPELIAHHYTEAQRFDDAIPFWLSAGQSASETSALTEAAGHLRRGIEIIESLPATPQREKMEFRFRTLSGSIFIALHGFAAPQTIAAYNRAYELRDTVDDPEDLAPMFYGLWVIRNVRSEHAEALTFAESILETADAGDDVLTRMLGYRMRGTSRFYIGRMADARRDLEDSLELYRTGEHDALAYRYAQDPVIAAQSISTWNLALAGHADQALHLADQIVDRAETLAHAPSSAWAYNFAGLRIGILRRDWNRIETFSERLRALSRQHGLAHWLELANVADGWRRAFAGEAQGLEHIKTDLSDRLKNKPERLYLPEIHAQLAEAHLECGSAQAANDAITAALQIVAQTGERFHEAELYHIRGKALLSVDQDAAAEAFEQALDIAQSQQAKLWQLRAATSLARLRRAQGKAQDAHDLLAPVYDWFTEGFDTPDLTEAKALLDELK